MFSELEVFRFRSTGSGLHEGDMGGDAGAFKRAGTNPFFDVSVLDFQRFSAIRFPS
jgi:hypothetical protein